MVKLFLDKNLPDYFGSCDYRDPASMKTLISRYEAGEVILLANKRIDFDSEFFSTITFPPGGEYKKFKTVQYVESLRRGNGLYPTLAADCFGGDAGKARYFGEQLSSIVHQFTDILGAAAPSYKIKSPRLTLRCAPTFNENLHVDVYKEEIATHHFRMFVNLDSAHRIWHTSWRLDYLLSERLKELPQPLLQTATPGRLIKELNFHVFGGYDSTFEDRAAPRHLAYFEPGEIWFVDSRKVSHQIFYGRRAISSESVVEEANMADNRSHYLRMAEACRRAMLTDGDTERLRGMDQR